MFKKITSNFTKYICNNDGKKLAELFSKDGCYHDYIYGSFTGKNEINDMLSNYFHRDGENFFWEMYDHAFENDIGYCRYRFGFTSKLSEYRGKKVSIPGIGFFKFKDGLIEDYSESVNGGLAMVQLGVNPLKMEKVFLKWLKRSFDEDPDLNKR